MPESTPDDTAITDDLPSRGGPKMDEAAGTQSGA